MKAIYIPYEQGRDPETGFQVLSALDKDGQVRAVVSEASREAAEMELLALMIHLLEAEAAEGRDRFRDFPDAPPAGPHLVLGPIQILPLRIKLARAQARLRQADMASLLGITQQTYAKLERPGANPTLQTLAQLETALGRDLLGWA